MIMLCERCFAEIGAGEPVVRLAHIDGAGPDGSLAWRHSFLHVAPCAPAGTAPCAPAGTAPRRPDTGAWNPSRGVAARRR